MSIPGFTADRAVGPAGFYRLAGGGSHSRATVAPALSNIGRGPALSNAMHAPAGLFWPCFRNCYDRCWGDSGACMTSCYYICDWNPNVWF
jgi:hypothetical protein